MVEEKLTYVNNHARLSMELTHRIIRELQPDIIRENSGMLHIIQEALNKAIGHYTATCHILTAPGDVGPPKTELLPRHDKRLESLVYYLIKNDDCKSNALLELAVLEQFSFPGLENNTAAVNMFRMAAEKLLAQRRKTQTQEAAVLRQWHQAYHLFRRSAHCFVNALDALNNRKFFEALDLFTEAYNYSQKVSKVPIQASVAFLCSRSKVRDSTSICNFRAQTRR